MKNASHFAMIYNHFHNTLRLFDVYQTFLSPKVKRCAIITYKYGIYELPYELPNDLRLNIIFADGGAQCPHKKKKDLISEKCLNPIE